MKSKKGLSDVIVTVLMILLVIAAIAIIWAVLANFLKTGTGNLNPSQLCTTTSLSIVGEPMQNNSANRIETRVIRSGPTAEELTAVVIYRDGYIKQTNTTQLLAVGESKIYVVPNSSTGGTSTMKVAPAFGDADNPYICPPSEEVTAVKV